MATECKTYVEFEPYSEWKKDADSETLIVHLPEFKRNQLRVQVNTHGILKVSGEKPEEGKTQTKRFYKESNIPQGCDINDIRAKFSNGCLHVIMPKKKEPISAKAESSGVRDDEKQDTPKKAPMTSTTTDQRNNNDQVFGNGNAILRMIERQKKNKLVVNVGIGIAVAAVVAIGAYVAIKYGSDSASASASASAATTSSSSAQIDEVRPN